MTDAMIRLEHVSKTFPGSATAAVGDLSFDVPEGEIIVLVGPSGCGKTTTLKMINRIIEPSSGDIWVAGANAAQTEPHVLRRQIGYVIQQTGLFPHRTIAQNIATVPRLLGWDRSKINDRVVELIDMVGLDLDMAHRFPTELSGGQQQRVGVARALAADPPVLLMDEPFGAVDPIVRTHLQIELLGLQARVQKTIVFVTHDIDEAIQLGDRVAILNVGGVLEQIGSPEDILREPANDFVAEFLGTANVVKGEAVTRDGHTWFTGEGGWRIQLPSRLPASGAGALVFRPQNVLLSVADDTRQENDLIGHIAYQEFLGSSLRYGVQVGNHRVLVDEHHRHGLSPFEKGQSVKLSVDAESLVWIGQ